MTPNAQSPVPNKSLLRWVWWLPLLAIGTFYLFYSGPEYHAARSIKELWNLGHIGYFALLIVLLAKIPYLFKYSLAAQWSGLLLLSVVLGVGIELLQYGTTRTPDLGDVSRDMTGALLALAFHPRLSAFARSELRWLWRVLALLVLLIHLVPISVALLDEANARRQFPLLSSFETPFEIDRWRCNARCRVVEQDDGVHVLEIALNTRRYSGAGMDYFPSDWRDYQTLNLVFFNPDDAPLRFTLRVHDRQHEQGATAYATRDRFNRRYVLKQGWNKISVSLAQIEHAPRGRLMDMAQIADVSFFVSRLRAARKIYLERIYLL